MNEKDGAARIFGLEEGEGEARWWAGGLATIKGTGKGTNDLYSIVEVLEPQGAKARSTCPAKRTRTSSTRRRDDLPRRRGDDQSATRLVLRPPKDVPHTYTVDSGPAKLLFLLAPGLRGLRRGHQQAGQGTHSAAIRVGGPVGRDDTTDRGRVGKLAVLEARQGARSSARRRGTRPARNREGMG